jgi:hypothetical protein
MWIIISLGMFKITQNTLRYFTLTEVLLMAAMNQLEVKRQPSTAQNMCGAVDWGCQ